MDTESIEQKYREPDVAADVTRPLARRLRDSQASLTYRWLERIESRLEMGADQVFPSDELLDHVPLLLEAIADFMENPTEEGTAADKVIAKATELGEMRFAQGFSVYQVLKEFEILGGMVLSFMRIHVKELGFTPSPEDVLILAHRVHRALAKIQQTTAARHIKLLEEKRRDLDHRLRLVHGVARDAADSLDEADRDVRRRLDDIRYLSDTGKSSRRKGIPLQGAMREAVRRVRPIAQDTELEVVVDDDVPDVEVPDAEVEHCLVVYLTNAVRHCTETDGERKVTVGARQDGDARELLITVRNTGAMVHATDDITIFVEPDADEAPSERGVGLRFARDMIASMGGRTWAEPVEEPAGTLFGLALPARRGEDDDAP